MREPQLGELLICGACGEDAGFIDEEWLEYWDQIPEKMRPGMYNPRDDRFIGYDECMGD